MLAYSANFAAYLTAHTAAVGMLPANATTYAALQTSFATKLTAAQSPETRGKATILSKDTVKKQLIALTRGYAQMIGRNINVTNDQRSAMGLNIRKQRAPLPPPALAPVIQIVSVNAWTVKIKLKNADGTRRARPIGAAGAAVFSYTGATPPNSIADWAYEGLCGKDLVDTVLFAIPGRASLNNPVDGGADPAKWTAVYGGTLYVGNAFTFDGGNALTIYFNDDGSEGGPDVLNYRADPSDISDTSGRMLAAVNEFPI